jgi:hypothetical protein
LWDLRSRSRLRVVAPTHRFFESPHLVSGAGVEESGSRNIEPSNGDGDSAAEPGSQATPGSSTDATIGRFRDAVQSIKDPSPSSEPPADPAAPDSIATASINNTAGPLKSVMAEQFVLVDSRGEPRATLALEAGGSPALSLNDASGRVRAAVRIGADGVPSIVLYDPIGRRRLEVALKPDGAAGLGLYDETGEGRAELVVSGSGVPSLSLYGPSGKRVAKLPTGRER